MKRKKVDLPRLLKLARPHTKLLTLATFALFFASALGLLYPQAARVGIDDVIAGTSDIEMSVLGVALVALLILQATFGGLRYYLFTVIGERVVADLRKRLYGAIVQQEIGFFDETKTGELTSRLTADTAVLQNTVTSNLSMALRFGVQAIGGVAILFVSSWKLALVMLLAVPTVIVVAIFFGKKVRVLSRQVQDRLADSTAIADETLGGIRTVRSFAAEANARAEYGGAVEESFVVAKKRAVIGGAFGALMTTMAYGSVGVILFFGGRMVMDGEMTPGELTAFLLYTLMVAFALGTLSGLWTDFMKAVGSAERVFELIDREPILNLEGGEKISTIGDVEFDNVTFAYPTRPEINALKEVSFKLERGTKMALVGPSGSGKSTVGSLVLRFYDPQSGAIRIDGTSLTDLDATILREHIGVVSQEPVLFSGTIEDNVLYAKPDADPEAVVNALKASNAWEFVSDFPEGLKTLIGERGVRLSGGQKQRIAIARALLKDPEFLILDEATSALDVESEALVQQALDSLMVGRTTIIIAHRLSTVAGADKVLVLEHGSVVEFGSHSELIEAQGTYHRLIESQRLLA